MAWTTAVWNDEFKIEFDVVVRKDLDAKWSNIFHLTSSGNEEHNTVVHEGTKGQNQSL